MLKKFYKMEQKNTTETPKTDALFYRLKKRAKPVFEIAKEQLKKQERPIILENIIGCGGFAVVAKGNTTLSIDGREKELTCAVKIVYPERIYGNGRKIDNANRKRFDNEHSSTRQVYTNLKEQGRGLEKHIVRVYDKGEFDYDKYKSLDIKERVIVRTLAKILGFKPEISWRYIVSEYVEGKDLSHYKGELSIKEILQLSKVVCDVLEETHRQKFIHRDIKPTNILIPYGKIPNLKITDYGLAKRIDSGAPVYGSILGSMGFAAPEQIDYKSRFKVDGRTDEYNLAATILFMGYDNYPYSEKDVELLHSKEHMPIPKPTHLKEIISEKPIREVLMKALSPWKGGRYPTIGEFREALEYVDRKL